MKTCSVEGCNRQVWGRGLCKIHSPVSLNKNTDTTKRNEFFQKIWNYRPHISEVSGKPLGHTIRTTFFHHILEKRNHKDAEFDEENIVLLTPEEHATVEQNIYKYPKINYMREKLKLKYGIL